MGGRRRHLFVLLFVLGIIAVSALVIATKPTRLGLDLKGGVELVYQGQPSGQVKEVTGEDIDRSINIIRERIDELGVAEPEVSRLGETEISVQLPDVTNAQRAIDQVGTTAQLYFYDWEPNLIGIEKTVGGRPGQQPPQGAVQELEQIWRDAGRNANSPLNNQLVVSGALPTAYEAVRLAAEEEPDPGCTQCSEASPRYYLFDRSADHELLAGPEKSRKDLFVSPTGEKRPRNGEILIVPPGTVVVSEQPVDAEGETIPEEEHPPGWYALRDRPALSGTDITNPEQSFDQFNQPNVTFGFTDDGREAFHDVTRRIAQRGAASAIGPVGTQDAATLSGHFAVILDNVVVTRPIINFAENPDGIDGRTGAEISGGFTSITEAQDLATFLQIGALPIDLQLISQSEVSATLGQEALDQGLKAGIVGLILVICFLIAYYRFLGVVATLGLGVYAVFFFALIEVVPITMTLPGIAGLILTIGVAADSNIVIFERIKEEVRAGRSLSTAIAVGYRRGIATIIDANVITLLTAFILFVLATAGVKGFAFTLGIGTLVSLFTAVVFTQAFLAIFGRGVLTSPRLLGAGEQRVRWHFDFTGLSRWFFSFSGIILLVGAFSLASNQLNFGIDFESGTRLTFAPERAADVEQIRDTLEAQGLGDAEIQEVSSEAFPDGFQVQTGELQPGGVGEVRSTLEQEFGIQSGSFENTSVGPTFGEQVARSAGLAILFSLLLISGYVALRFEAKYAVPVLIAVAHDILITAGVYSLADREVTSATVAAFLTILGYSLYDTVIVFDRIRENVPRMPRAPFSQIVNRSMSEVLTRSLITGLSSVFLVTMLLIFGGATLKDFAFAMMVGIASGTYSSIFIASPVLTAWKEREPAFRGRRERIEKAVGYVPAFAEEIEVAKLRSEGEALEEEEALAEEDVEETERMARKQRVVDEVAEAVTDDELAAGDGAPEPAPEPEPLVGAGTGPSAERKQRNAKRRRQRQRRRKHGRHR
jgi:SecD/SecF fusion protein